VHPILSRYIQQSGVVCRLLNKEASRWALRMIIGAVIAGFVIVSLLLETFASSPKSDDPVGGDEKHVL
jgi:hypothetical protein